MKKKILLTGASGFTGLHLLKALLKSKKYKLAVIKRPRSSFSIIKSNRKQVVFYDLKSNSNNLFEILKSEKPDIVIHLAGFFQAEHQSNEIEEMMKTNLLLGTKLLEAMARNGVKRLITAGTFWEYYEDKKIYNPVNLYAATKHAFSDILQYYIEAEGIKAVTLQIYDTYGSADPRKKLFYYLKNALTTGKTLEMSPAEQFLDLVYIDDVVEAYLKAVEYLLKKKDNRHEIFQIGSGKAVKLKNVVRLFEKIAGRKLSIKFGGRPYRKREVMSAKADIRKAKKVLGWRPKVSLTSGIQRILGL
ncbi:NAD(P)-dependent oxidoreductase [Candidatus Microgenomates bacterium]|nr:NAD(P)-dependent oxidoreductase [Candidatus Microgenomates bacterium]